MSVLFDIKTEVSYEQSSCYTCFIDVNVYELFLFDSKGGQTLFILYDCRTTEDLENKIGSTLNPLR